MSVNFCVMAMPKITYFVDGFPNRRLRDHYFNLKTVSMLASAGYDLQVIGGFFVKKFIKHAISDLPFSISMLFLSLQLT